MIFCFKKKKSYCFSSHNEFRIVTNEASYLSHLKRVFLSFSTVSLQTWHTHWNPNASRNCHPQKTTMNKNTSHFITNKWPSAIQVTYYKNLIHHCPVSAFVLQILIFDPFHNMFTALLLLAKLSLWLNIFYLTGKCGSYSRSLKDISREDSQILWFDTPFSCLCWNWRCSEGLSSSTFY